MHCYGLLKYKVVPYQAHKVDPGPAHKVVPGPAHNFMLYYICPSNSVILFVHIFAHCSVH